MTATAHELLVVDEPDAVPRARQFVTTALADLGPDVLDDALLVTTELVTNALLHGAPPIVLRISASNDGVRIEVDDAGRHLPMRVQATAGAMTGRGLGLVGALSTDWGATSTDTGKTVWAELSSAPATRLDRDMSVDLDALLADWEDLAGEPQFTVELGAVPTDLLLEAKAHIDNLVREFTLMASGANQSAAEQLPEQLAELVQTVVHGFADARAQIKQQAVAAAARGAAETHLRLVLPLSAADAGERYLAALDEADRQARAARLLTLETPPVHRVFRQWCVQTLVDQLRKVAAGEPTVSPDTFQQRLAAEVTRLAPLSEVAARLSLLQQVTADLTAAATTDEVVRAVCENAHDVLGALSARVYLLGDDEMLRSAATSGAADASTMVQYDEFPASADLPGAVALRTGKAVVLRSLADIADQFPQLAGIYPDERTLLVAPLVVGDSRLGVLSLTFRGQGAIDEETQRAFLTTLADVTAQALERAAVARRAEEANERLSFLAEASVILSSSLDYRGVLEAVAGLVVPRLADWCVIQLLEAGRLTRVALSHVDPAKVVWARQIASRYQDQRDVPAGPAAEVMRTGRSELYPELPDELLDRAAVDADHRELLRQMGMRSALVVPLSGRTGVIGALTMIYAESGRRYREQDVAFVEDLARRAALAVETAHAFHEQSGRLAQVQRVAEAAQHAILSPPPAVIGGTALAARYVSAAEEALVGGDLYEVVQRQGAVRLLIGDVKGKGLEAVRIATVVLGEFRAAAADVPDLVAVVSQLDRRLRPYLSDEDFVTALVAEIRDDGGFTVVNCGHPPALLASAAGVEPLETAGSLPLGLGAAPVPVTGRLQIGDRLFLYTDGMIEARTADGRFVELHEVTAALSDGALDDVLDGVLEALATAVGAELGDDLALVVAEHRGLPAG